LHSYLRAIGFSNIKRGKELDHLLQEVFHGASEKSMVKEDDSASFAEYLKDFGDDIGIALCGILDETGFHQEYYFPYYRGSEISTKEEVIVEKHGGKESYLGVCEDIRIGVSLIFYLQNAAKYKREKILNNLLNGNSNTSFSGLSLKGKILLPINKNEGQRNTGKETSKNRNHLLAEAKKGNEEAIESLTLEDIDLYAEISRRIQKEDVFTIVESFFMPYGMECDQYHIMGEIKRVSRIFNSLTNEAIYQMSMECNDMMIDVCINETDLQGEPTIGRRFKGVIWLQGQINFTN